MKQFYKHYNNKIKNTYLYNINQMKHVENNLHYFQHYFNTVKDLLIYISTYIKFNKYIYEFSNNILINIMFNFPTFRILMKQHCY